MPEVSRFYGIVIRMYWNEHPPPHFHARYGSDEALLAIESGDVVRGVLPPRALRMVRHWAEEHYEELLDNWERSRMRINMQIHRPAGVRVEIAEVIDVVPLEPHWLRLTFADGSVHEVDVGKLDSGLFAEMHNDPEVFAQVRVNPETGTIEWPGGLDLDPDVLHGDFEPLDGEPYSRRVIRGPREHAR